MTEKKPEDVRVLECESNGSDVEILEGEGLSANAQELGEEPCVDNEKAGYSMRCLTREVDGLGLYLRGVEFEITYYPDHASPAIPRIQLHCMHEGKDIAQTFARLIDKFMIAQPGRGFYCAMDAAGPACRNLTVTIFDPLGSVKSKWTTNPESKGSGIRYQSLSHGNFLVIEISDVLIYYRREMIGRKMVEAIFKEGINQKAEYTFVWATQLNTAQDASKVDDPNSEVVFQGNKTRAIAFWRAMGFRLIGLSHWFGYAMDPADPSHRLAAAQDFDPVDGTIPVEDNEKFMLEYVGGNAQVFRAVFGRG